MTNYCLGIENIDWPFTLDVIRTITPIVALFIATWGGSKLWQNKINAPHEYLLAREIIEILVSIKRMLANIDEIEVYTVPNAEETPVVILTALFLNSVSNKECREFSDKLAAKSIESEAMWGTGFGDFHREIAKGLHTLDKSQRAMDKYLKEDSEIFLSMFGKEVDDNRKEILKQKYFSEHAKFAFKFKDLEESSSFFDKLEQNTNDAIDLFRNKLPTK